MSQNTKKRIVQALEKSIKTDSVTPVITIAPLHSNDDVPSSAADVRKQRYASHTLLKNMTEINIVPITPTSNNISNNPLWACGTSQPILAEIEFAAGLANPQNA
jgi:hypothetical protein